MSRIIDNPRKITDPKRVFITINYKDFERLKDRGSRRNIEKILRAIGASEVYFTKVDNAEIAAFAKWKESEISEKLHQIEYRIPGTKVLEKEILIPA